MDTNASNMPLNEELLEKFKQLPPVLQDAILSAEVEGHLRSLSQTHKLHLDQWGKLENEVMMALLGVQPVENLPENIRKEVGIDAERADALALDISNMVFEPIRQQLERELGNKNAEERPTTAIEDMRTQILAKPGENITPPEPPTAQPAHEANIPVVPATPPAPPPQGSAARAPISEVYKAGESSTARKAVHDDPYRESPV